ncbi:helix-turn-helix domain-containing protein [Mesorhizobium silamurunense]|uniref:helix-turn-helix domain-containing protein n=1 Tax=Mesorhizobium silamurunense TaxID=499528 RepID=UPI001AEEF662
MYAFAVRLDEAHRLLEESIESIASIALRCGLVSASHLGSAYRKAFDRRPGEERRNPSSVSTTNRIAREIGDVATDPVAFASVAWGRCALSGGG